ncbi:hypothetical protein CLCR_11281 [Cladophialophora carrionii]|uniref:Uncharacterized protein n=1 Tax=Cladophialophora carrionii TaxID=86049 RepID=A0A1C1CGJ5_9EURO|nr:hypothetical protein CLCR_11281 [Cladophialophora carrionii]
MGANMSSSSPPDAQEEPSEKKCDCHIRVVRYFCRTCDENGVRTLLPSPFYRDNPRKFWVVDITCEGHGRSEITKDVRSIKALLPCKRCKICKKRAKNSSQLSTGTSDL